MYRSDIFLLLLSLYIHAVLTNCHSINFFLQNNLQQNLSNLLCWPTNNSTIRTITFWTILCVWRLCPLNKTWFSAKCHLWLRWKVASTMCDQRNMMGPCVILQHCQWYNPLSPSTGHCQRATHHLSVDTHNASHLHHQTHSQKQLKTSQIQFGVRRPEVLAHQLLSEHWPGMDGSGECWGFPVQDGHTSQVDVHVINSVLSTHNAQHTVITNSNRQPHICVSVGDRPVFYCNCCENDYNRFKISHEALTLCSENLQIVKAFNHF